MAYSAYREAANVSQHPDAGVYDVARPPSEQRRYAAAPSFATAPSGYAPAPAPRPAASLGAQRQAPAPVAPFAAQPQAAQIAPAYAPPHALRNVTGAPAWNVPPPVQPMARPETFAAPAEVVENDELAPVVVALRRVTGHSLQAALEAGEIIFRYVFKGDETLLRARGKKCSSFRKLASHADLGMSSSSLWRAVAIYELAVRFPEISEYVHTGVGHISVVLGLPAADQFTLLRQTEAKRWTRRKLQKVVAEIRLAERGEGVLPTSKLVDRLAGLEMLAQDVILERQLMHVSGIDAQRALKALSNIRELLTNVESRLNRALL